MHGTCEQSNFCLKLIVWHNQSVFVYNKATFSYMFQQKQNTFYRSETNPPHQRKVHGCWFIHVEVTICNDLLWGLFCALDLWEKHFVYKSCLALLRHWRCTEGRTLTTTHSFSHSSNQSRYWKSVKYFLLNQVIIYDVYFVYGMWIL